jgi:hypothetical protein
MLSPAVSGHAEKNNCLQGKATSMMVPCRCRCSAVLPLLLPKVPKPSSSHCKDSPTPHIAALLPILLPPPLQLLLLLRNLVP